MGILRNPTPEDPDGLNLCFQQDVPHILITFFHSQNFTGLKIHLSSTFQYSSHLTGFVYRNHIKNHVYPCIFAHGIPMAPHWPPLRLRRKPSALPRQPCSSRRRCGTPRCSGSSQPGIDRDPGGTGDLWWSKGQKGMGKMLQTTKERGTKLAESRDTL